MVGQNTRAQETGGTRGRSISVAVLVGSAALWVACGSAPADPGLVHREEAESSMAEGAPQKAVDAYRRALAVAPDDLRALRGLLEAEVAAGDGEAALRTLADLENRDRMLVDPCPTLALVIAGRRQTGGDALSPARRALDRRCGGAARRLAEVHADESARLALGGERGSALEQITNAISLDSSRPDYYARAAELLIAEGRAEAAVALLATGLAGHPDARELRDLMVRALSIR